MPPNGKERRHEARKAARELLGGIASGEAEVYVTYRRLYVIWCSQNAAVQELRPMFRLPGVAPDGQLSVTPEFEAQVRALATEIMPMLDSFL